MPGSGEAEDPRAELEALEDALGRLLERYGELRERVDEAERSRARLEEALRETGGEEGPPASERIEELSRENRRLRETIDEARERASRIRSRLIMMEDEVTS